MFRLALLVLLVLFPSVLFAIDPIPRRLPPPGINLPEFDQQRLTVQSKELRARLAKLAATQKTPIDPDIEVFLKAVDWALEFNEFGDAKQVSQADWALKQAEERLGHLAAGKKPWTVPLGRVARGYRSAIDDTVQPYGLEFPANLDRTKPIPLFVFLHGRGEKQTDLPFLFERGTKASGIAPEGAIVVHPFGRQCIGHKSAGEIDVLDVAAKTVADYKLDPRRVVLMGFSMGGAGAWHIGAHYTDRWCAISPGAGFSETARFFKLNPNGVPWYEKSLWGVYDVPCYVRNLFNVPVIAYSGEIDGQIQAARVMEEAYAAEGEKLTHLIGPMTAHAYHPETKKELLKRLCDIALAEPKTPTTVHLQTRTLSYNKQFWVTVTGLGEHWRDARVDVERVGDGEAVATTRNVTGLLLDFDAKNETPLTLSIDGQKLTAPRAKFTAPGLVNRDGKWSVAAAPDTRLAKRPDLQGPIDDAFRFPFLFVKPSGKSRRPQVQEWVEFELAHAIDRWRTVFRGEPRVKLDTDVTPDDIKTYHLVLWGDPESNKLIAKINDKLPVRWQGNTVVAGGKSFDAATHLPLLIYPQPLEGGRGKYVVLNSGTTFRESDDNNNSQQNPKLPDWAILDLSVPPTGKSIGKPAATDFFDEAWQLKPEKPKGKN